MQYRSAFARSNSTHAYKPRVVHHSQNRQTRLEQQRSHLDLQINLLAEKEATSILKILREIADHLNVDVSDDVEHEELAKDTAVESIARDLRTREDRS